MGVIDKFLDVMRLNDDDDYENENEEYWDDEEEEEEEKPKKSSRKKESRSKSESKRETRETRESRDGREEKEAFINERNERETKEKTVSNNPKITPINKSQRRQAMMANMEVCIFKPTKMEDELEITDILLKGKTVLINLEGLNVEIAQRIVDFTTGSSYAMSGKIQKISNYIFLATPNGVEISGDINEILETFDDDTSGFSF